MYILLQDGGFYSAEDADSLPTATSTEKKEGAFCVWEFQELQSLLTEKASPTATVSQAEVFSHYYGVKEAGNVDPMQVLDNDHHKLQCFIMIPINFFHTYPSFITLSLIVRVFFFFLTPLREIEIGHSASSVVAAGAAPFG